MMADRVADRVIVVGSGLAGLVAGCSLVNRGIETTILEKNSFIGGYNSCFEREGYRLDVGATMLQTPEVLEETLGEIGVSLSPLHLMPLDTLYGVRFRDGRELKLLPSVEGTAENIARFSSSDAKAFLRYVADVEDVKRAVKNVLIDDAGARRYLTADALRLVRALNPFKSVWRLTGSYFKTYEVQAALSFQTLYLGAPPHRCPAIYGSIPYFEIAKGVWHIRGGLHSLSALLAASFVRMGGTLRTDAEVDEILVNNGAVAGVRLADGENLEAAMVVSNAEATYTYTRLLAPRTIPSRHRWRLQRMGRSCSAQVTLFGLRREDLVEGTNHHTFFIPADFQDLCREVFDKQSMPNDFFAYVCASTVTDPSVAPAGRAALYILLLAPSTANGAAVSADAREEAGVAVAQALIEHNVLRERHRIEMRKIFTPSDFLNTFHQPGGMGFGIAPTFTQVGRLRPAARSPFVRNLYLAGASTNPGCGIPLVLSSGRAAAAAALADRGVEKPLTQAVSP